MITYIKGTWTIKYVLIVGAFFMVYGGEGTARPKGALKLDVQKEAELIGKAVEVVKEIIIPKGA